LVPAVLVLAGPVGEPCAVDAAAVAADDVAAAPAEPIHQKTHHVQSLLQLCPCPQSPLQRAVLLLLLVGTPAVPARIQLPLLTEVMNFNAIITFALFLVTMRM